MSAEPPAGGPGAGPVGSVDRPGGGPGAAGASVGRPGGVPDVDAAAGNPGGMTGEALAAELPAAVAPFARDATWDLVGIDPTGATLWHLVGPDGLTVRLAVAPGAPGESPPSVDGVADTPTSRLAAEAARLRWLAPDAEWDAAADAGSGADPDRGELAAGDAPGTVRVLAEAIDPESGERFVVTTVPVGTPALSPEHRGDVDGFVAALADGLRRWHGRPVPHASPAGAAAPAVDLDQLMDRAARRVERGLVDPAGFAPVHVRYAPAELLGHLRTLRAALPDVAAADGDRPVVVHGRPTLANTLLHGGVVTAYTGLDRAGVGDRYLDLAVVARDLAEQVSPHALGPFFAAYGLPSPDLGRLDAWLLLLELL